MTNTLTFDFDYNHNIFETLVPYYSYITKIDYHTENPNPTISITFTTLEILNQFKTENYL